MVESRACMSDHRPQKKWDARENLCSKTYGQWLSTVLIEYVMLCWLTTVLLPVDLHVHLLLHLHLVFFVQVVKPWVGFPQVALDEVKLKGQTSWRNSAVENKTQHAAGMEWYQNLLVEQCLFNKAMVRLFSFLGMRKPESWTRHVHNDMKRHFSSRYCKTDDTITFLLNSRRDLCFECCIHTCWAFEGKAWVLTLKKGNSSQL